MKASEMKEGEVYDCLYFGHPVKASLVIHRFVWEGKERAVRAIRVEYEDGHGHEITNQIARKNLVRRSAQ